VLSVVCALFDGGDNVPDFSRCYSPLWVDKLYRGVCKHLGEPFRFVCLTHYPQRAFLEPVEAVPFLHDNRRWTCLMEAFRPDIVGERAILMGLDTIIRGPLDELAAYRGKVAMCRAVGAPQCSYNNAVMLYDAEIAQRLWLEWSADPTGWEKRWLICGKPSELAFIDGTLKAWGVVPDLLETLFPGQALCYNYASSDEEMRAARVVWFFGHTKPHNMHQQFLKDAWT